MRKSVRGALVVGTSLALGAGGLETYQYLSANPEAVAVANYVPTVQAIGDNALRAYGHMPHSQRFIGEGGSLVSLSSRRAGNMVVTLSATYDNATAKGFPTGHVEFEDLTVTTGTLGQPDFAVLESLQESTNQLSPTVTRVAIACTSQESGGPGASPDEYNQEYVAYDGGSQSLNYGKADTVVNRDLEILDFTEQALAHGRVNAASYPDICGSVAQTEPLPNLIGSLYPLYSS